MRKVIIKCCEHSAWLRSNALKKIEEYETVYSKDKKNGIYSGVLWVISTFDVKPVDYQMYIYQTKTAFIADIRKI